jgi:long-subunit acyl-CoA synthetase (AMP-forming)
LSLLLTRASGHQGEKAKDLEWEYRTWAQYYSESVAFGKALMSLGFARHRCINILGFNAVSDLYARLCMRHQVIGCASLAALRHAFCMLYRSCVCIIRGDS